MATDTSITKPTFDEVVDEIYELVYDITHKEALDVLTACVTGIVERCPDPQRALLAVIAELTQLVRFGEARDTERVVGLDDWIANAWG